MRDILYTVLVLVLCWFAAHGDADEAVHARARLFRCVGIETCMPGRPGRQGSVFETIAAAIKAISKAIARLFSF